MSRCFPYPPRGYCKSGATYEALIESIKLQKESVKAVKDKSERKKEKREKKERKEKKREEKRKAKENQAIKKDPNEFLLNSKETCLEKQVIKKNPNEFLLNSKETCVEKVEVKTVSEIRTDLEKSDLTEEHSQPTTSQKPSYSSDSNSHKRKRDEVADGSSGLGKSIKIRLPKKHKTDSEPQTEVLCTKSGRSDTPCFTGADARLNLVSSNRTTGIPVTSGRENNPINGHPSSQTKPSPSSLTPAAKSNNIQQLQFASKQFASARLPLTHLKHDMPGSRSNKIDVPVPVPVPSRSNKRDVEVLPSARQPPVSTYTKPLLPLKRPICEITALDSSFPTRSVKRNENVALDNIVSTKIARIEKKTDNLISESPKKPKLSRHEKKLQKKFSKYEKVIGKWAPPVSEPPRLPVDDEDWLSRRGPKVVKTVETGQETAPSSLWQPCARFLVEADIYALPFTVPF